MMRDEYLEDWIEKMECKINGIEQEISTAKLKGIVNGINIEIATEKPEDPKTAFVSFEYLREKTQVLRSLCNAMRNEIREDAGATVEMSVKDWTTYFPGLENNEDFMSLVHNVNSPDKIFAIFRRSEYERKS